MVNYGTPINLNQVLWSTNATSGNDLDNNTLADDPCIDNSDYYRQWNYRVRFYGLYICIIIGVIGNGLSFVAFVRSKMCNSSTGIYLVTLAWIDTLVLIMELLVRMNLFAISDATCKMAYYFRYSIRLVEALTVVALCANRTACFHFPFPNHKIFSPAFAKKTVLVITVVAFTSCSYALFCISLSCICNISDTRQMVYFYTDIAISVILGEFVTSLLVILMAAYIIRTLHRIGPGMLPERGVDKLTQMTAAVALTFAITRLPYSVTYITYAIRLYVLGVPWASQIQQNLVMAVDLLAVVALLNYCINFFVYLIFWPSFRLSLASILTCCFVRCRRVPKEEMYMVPLKRVRRESPRITCCSCSKTYRFQT